MTDEEIKAKFESLGSTRSWAISGALYCFHCDGFFPNIKCHDDVNFPWSKFNTEEGRQGRINLYSHRVAYSYKEYNDLVAQAVLGRLEGTEDAGILETWMKAFSDGDQPYERRK